MGKVELIDGEDWEFAIDVAPDCAETVYENLAEKAGLPSGPIAWSRPGGRFKGRLSSRTPFVRFHVCGCFSLRVVPGGIV